MQGCMGVAPWNEAEYSLENILIRTALMISFPLHLIGRVA